jgi:branched-chain amino acid transport system permease protein
LLPDKILKFNYMLEQFIINGLITGMIYGLVALGFALVYNTTRIFHIAYAAIYMIAPYFMMYFFRTIELNIYISFILAVAATAFLGLLTDTIVYSPLSRKISSSGILIISSIGIMIIIINVVALIWGNETKVINPSISKSITFGNILITHTQLIQFFVSFVIIISFLIYLKYSRFGIKTRAYRDNPQLTEVMGTNTIILRRHLFLLSSAFAAVTACLVAYDVGMNPYVGMPMLLNAAVALIIGGVGKFHAPVLGGLMIGVLQAMVIYLASARWQDAVTFTLLILFLLLRPQGIMGEKIRKV